jgi:hypothetical protein
MYGTVLSGDFKCEVRCVLLGINVSMYGTVFSTVVIIAMEFCDNLLFTVLKY